MKKKIICISAASFLLLSLFSFLSVRTYENQLLSTQSIAFNADLYQYASFIPDKGDSFDITITADDMTLRSSASSLAKDQNEAHIHWVDGAIEITVYTEQSEIYNLYADYLPLNDNFENIRLDMTQGGRENNVVNGIVLPSYYRFESNVFAKNKKNNDIYPQQSMIGQWYRTAVPVSEESASTDTLALSLDAGMNTFRLELTQGELLLRALHFKVPITQPDYTDYRSKNPGEVVTEQWIIEAEHFHYKNKNSIGIANSASFTALPYATDDALLNVIDPKTFKEHNSKLAYLVEIDKTGYYHIGIKTAMPGKSNSPVFLDIEVDGTIPFNEFRAYELSYHKNQSNHYIDKYPVYLTEGVHEIAFVINGESYHAASRRLKEIADEISSLSIAITKITGNNQDKEREWVISEFLPDMVSDLQRWKISLAEVESVLLGLTGGKATEETLKIRVALSQLQGLIDEPNRVPYKLTVLSTGSSSILQMLSKCLLTINEQRLSVDQIIVGGDGTHLPVTDENILFQLKETAKRLMMSYSEGIKESGNEPIQIWVKRTQQYVDVLQSMTDEIFTPQTGIEVDFSLFTDQGKLTLANAAGKQPDAALGVDAYYINELALRGSLTDLNGFDGANATIQNAIPGSLFQMIIDDKLYGIPEWQEFYVLYYRRDIFEAFDWQVPETWDEVLLMLPMLSRNGMNFFVPLAGEGSFKTWPMTMPFYSMFGAEIYSPDGMQSTIDSDAGIAAMRYMTNLFKVYGMPLQVYSFYNSFRSGTIPIGITNITEYIKLSFSAPEIAGLWDIAPIPGFVNDRGVIERWSSGINMADCIFEASDKKAESWSFLQWWLSDDIQLEYMTRLQNMHGQEFLWLSGNADTLLQLSVPDAHREAIAEQMKWIKEAPKVPGGTFVERQVSDAFNKIVFNGEDVKSAIDDAVISANREIKRKMQEFGYVDPNGVMVREYKIPTLQSVSVWYEDD